MITKVYDKVKRFLNENWKFFFILIVLTFVFSYEFPYYIDAPGGLMDVSDKIKIEERYDSKGSFNLAYVSELKATIPTLLIAWIHPNWDILKEEEVLYDNETAKELALRDRLLLEEALGNATIVGYQKASKSVKIESEKVYVSYKMEDSITTLKVGDQILSLNGTKVINKEQLSEAIQSLPANEEYLLKVLYNGNEEERRATLQEINGRKIIGVVLTQISQISTDPKIEFHFSKNESGPSGGLMTALSIYNMLTEEDLTKGKRIVGTGTIDLDGTVGSIGGVKYKLKGAVKKKADIFLVPSGENYFEAVALKKKHHYDITIVSIDHFDEAVQYLKSL